MLLGFYGMSILDGYLVADPFYTHTHTHTHTHIHTYIYIYNIIFECVERKKER